MAISPLEYASTLQQRHAYSSTPPVRQHGIPSQFTPFRSYQPRPLSPANYPSMMRLPPPKVTPSPTPQPSLSRLERLPVHILTRISYFLGYKNVIRLSMTSRRFNELRQKGWLKSDWEDKFTFVLEQERKLRRKGGKGGASSSQFDDYACYMCFRIKDADDFANTTYLLDYAQVTSVDPHTDARRYRGLPSADPAETLDVRTQASVPSPYAEGSFASPTPSLLRLSGHQAPIPPPSLKYRPSQPGEVELLRNYCIRCGIESGLHPAGEAIETRLSKKRVWICLCGHQYNESQVERCATCGLHPVLSSR